VSKTDLPDGQISFYRFRGKRRFARAFSRQNRARRKTDFASRFKVEYRSTPRHQKISIYENQK